MQVCVPSTSAQIFHLLRRQAIRPLRRPLVVMSPKSLLRHKHAESSLEDLAEGAFHNVLAETDELDNKKVTRVVLCAGKIYYELRDKRRELELQHIAIVRVEQLYPFPDSELLTILRDYSNIKDVVWCQEEPRNQGAWYLTKHRIQRVLDYIDEKLPLSFAGRNSSAAPAAGYMALHLQEQAALVEHALGIDE